MSTNHTYATLKAALQNWEEDDGTEFETEIDTMIGLGELRIIRDFDLEIFNVKKSLSIISASQLVAKPVDMVAVKTIEYTNNSNEKVILEKKTDEYLSVYWPNSLTTGAPKFFSELNTTQWRVVPTPDGSYSGIARGPVRPGQLTSLNATTWISTHLGDMLFYACLIEAELYLKEDIISEGGRIAGIEAKYKARLGPAKFELNRQENSDYSPVRSTPKA